MVCLAAACSGGGSDDGPSAVVTAPERTTTTLSAVEREVEAAYLKSWDIYADAALRLTTERLAESYAGEQLTRTTADIQDRMRTRWLARISVDHSYHLRLLTPTRAEVHDQYVNHSVRLDPETSEPLEDDPRERVTETYALERTDGKWKVVGIVRD